MKPKRYFTVRHMGAKFVLSMLYLILIKFAGSGLLLAPFVDDGLYTGARADERPAASPR
jgi:hypothetical protein